MASRRSASRIACLVVLLCVFVGLFSASASAAPLATPNGLWTWVRPLPFGFPANAIASPAGGNIVRCLHRE